MSRSPAVRSRSAFPSRPIVRRLAGTPVLLLALLVMAPWLLFHALLSGAVLGGQALGRGPEALAQAIDYASRVALGR